MRKAANLIGLPVFTVDSGKQVGLTKDFLIDPTWHIQGIILESRHWFSSIEFIPWSDVLAAGEDAFTIPDLTVIQHLDEEQAFHTLLEGPHRIKGLPVLTAGGHQLGMVEDVYLDSNKGTQVVGYELSEGFISDLKDGRRWLPLPEKATKGEDAIMVPVHCEEEVGDSFVSKQE